MGKVVVETVIAAPIELCFELARDVDLHSQSAAFSNERVISPGRLTGILQLGDLVAFEGRHFGIRQTFVARITEMEPPHRFVDEMVSGAFSEMRHEHRFDVHAKGTLMHDLLEWRSPLGPLGTLADALFVQRHMEWFVRTKQANMARVIEERAAR